MKEKNRKGKRRKRGNQKIKEEVREGEKERRRKEKRREGEKGRKREFTYGCTCVRDREVVRL